MSRLRPAGPRRRGGRRRLPFFSVNRVGEASYQAGMQRHHLLPLPLHRGPHGDYNRMVAERVGQIEAHWAAMRSRDSRRALEHALMRLALLQGALRRRLLAVARRLRLNRLDPLGAGRDFSQIDALVEDLWRETGRDQRTKSDSTSMVLPPIASRNWHPPLPLTPGAMA